MFINKIIHEINIEAKTENRYWSQVYGGKSVEIEVGELLYGLVRAIKPRIIVETGTGNFYSSAHILQGIADNHFGFLHTYDIEKQFNEDDYREFKDKYIFYHGDSLENGKLLIDSLMFESIDFIFLDSDHTYEQVMAEFNLFFPYLKIGGMICFHDTTLDLGEQKAVNEIRLRDDIEMIRLYTSRGFDIGVKLS